MINKKIVLGKNPKELGVKDAVHVAIVSVRAAHAMKPGTRCSVTNGEAHGDTKGVGIADPFLKKNILRGQNILLLLNPDEVDNVQHTWEHKYDFGPPTTPPKLNYTLEETAKEYGVTYDQLMEAMNYIIKSDEKGYGNYSSAPYPASGTKTKEELEEIEDDTWSLWSEWADENLYEFENQGTACCPEYDYPTCPIFEVQ